jgi:hypothetical protein
VVDGDVRSVDGRAKAASPDDIQLWYVELVVLPVKAPMAEVLDTGFAAVANAPPGPFSASNTASQKPGCLWISVSFGTWHPRAIV